MEESERRINQLEKRADRTDEELKTIHQRLTENKDGKLIVCHKCGHSRKTKSLLGQVSCSNCGAKIKI